MPFGGTQGEAIENSIDRLCMILRVEDRHADFGFNTIVLVSGAHRTDDFGLELDGPAIGQILADQDPNLGSEFGCIGKFDSCTGRREFEQRGTGSEESRADPNRMADQNALSTSAFWTAIDLVE